MRESGARRGGGVQLGSAAQRAFEGFELLRSGHACLRSRSARDLAGARIYVSLALARAR